MSYVLYLYSNKKFENVPLVKPKKLQKYQNCLVHIQWQHPILIIEGMKCLHATAQKWKVSIYENFVNVKIMCEFSIIYGIFMQIHLYSRILML